MKVKNTLSCIIPVKGLRPYFNDALASVEKQDVEVEIIVQDGDVEFDKGQSDALNKGFAKAHGEWLFWLNADDVLLPGALKNIISCIRRHKHIEWIVGNQVLIDDEGKVIKCSVGNGWHNFLYRHAVPHVYAPSAFFKRELLEKVGGCDVSLNYCMDWDLWIKFMQNGAKFFRINDYMWAQRQWGGSKTQRVKSRCESEKQWEEIAHMLARNGIESTLAGTMLVRIWRLLNGNIPRQLIDELRFCGKHYSEISA